LGKGRIWNEVWCYWEHIGNLRGEQIRELVKHDIGHLMRTLKEFYGMHLGTPNFKTLF
jgi:hypothetical protein